MMDRDSILVIEDEAIVAIDLSSTLESLGYSVLKWLKSGEEALEFLRQAQPDLILMDIKLKGKLDGIQTADAIRRSYDLPVIFLTAYSDKETLNRAKMSLPYGYITKSYNLNDLRSTMEMALYKHRMEKRLREQQQVLDLSLNAIHAAVIETSGSGEIRYYNKSAMELLEIEPGEKIGDSVDTLNVDFICSSGSKKSLSRLADDGESSSRSLCTCFTPRREEGIPLECSVQSYADVRGNTQGYVHVLRDIREELKFYELQSRLASIVENSDDAIISLALDGTITSWNNAASRMFGYSSPDVVGKNFTILTPAFLPDTFPELLEKMKTGAHHDSFDTIRRRKDGSTLHVSIMLSPIRNKEGKLHGVSVIARDITEKRALEASVLDITEKERIRIGQDLHDSLGQHLTGVLLNMKILENDIGKSGFDHLVEEAERVSGLVRDGIKKTRDLAKNLAPPIIESEGIREALKTLVSSTEELYRMGMVLEIDPACVEPEAVTSIQLYRIAQEAVHNAVKHSGASTVSVELKGLGNELLLVVSDDGRGIENRNTGGMGISIMNYRADIINGTLSVTDRPGGGTKVSCRLPLQKRK